MKERLEPPEFIEIPESLEILRGSNATFSAQATGRPAPKVTWYKDGRPIRRLARLLSLDSDEDPLNRVVNSIVKLADVAPELNDGVYTVEAVNSVGSVKHEVTLLGKPRNTPFLAFNIIRLLIFNHFLLFYFHVSALFLVLQF